MRGDADRRTAGPNNQISAKGKANTQRQRQRPAQPTGNAKPSTHRSTFPSITHHLLASQKYADVHGVRHPYQHGRMHLTAQ